MVINSKEVAQTAAVTATKTIHGFTVTGNLVSDDTLKPLIPLQDVYISDTDMRVPK